MRLKCASCGWMDEVVHGGETFGHELAWHLRTCPKRDDARYVPRWAQTLNGLECGWTTDTNGACSGIFLWHPFTAVGLEQIGGEAARAAPRPLIRTPDGIPDGWYVLIGEDGVPELGRAKPGASRRGVPSALPESPKKSGGAVSREGET